MADPGFPGQHSTTTTVTTNTAVRTNIRYDQSYIKTFPGIIKIAVIVLNLLGFICIECSHYSYSSRGNFFNIVSMIGFWLTLILLLFYLFHIIEKFYRIPWLKIEMVYCALWTLMYLIAACLAATIASGDEAYQVAAFFGFCAMVCYGIDAFLKCRGVQSGQLAQGERVINKQTTTTTSPAY